jgi:hypothetical protein
MESRDDIKKVTWVDWASGRTATWACLYSVASLAWSACVLRGACRIASDSVYYAGAADYLAHHGRLALPIVFPASLISPYTNFPPLYPLILSVPALLGFDPFVVAPLLNMVLSAVGIACLFVLCRRLGLGAGSHAVAVVSLSLSSSMVMTGSLMAEALYFACSCGFLWALTAWLLAEPDSRTSRTAIVTLGILATAAAMTRYLGLSLCAASIVLALHLIRKRARACTYARAGSWLIALPCLACGVWWFRNQFIVHDLGMGLTSRLGFGDVGLSLHALYWPFYQFFWPLCGYRWFVNYAALAFFAAMVLALVLWGRRIAGRMPSANRWFWAYLTVYLVFYVVLSLSNRTGMTAEDLQRFFQPIYPLMLVWVAVPVAASRFSPRVRNAFVVIVVTAVVGANIAKSFTCVPSYIGTGLNRFEGLRASIRPDSSLTILSSDPVLAYYLLRRPVRALTAAQASERHLQRIGGDSLDIWVDHP